MDVESKNGVIQSSIALLQERFRQLQKEKEMRQRKGFLKSSMIIMSTSSSSSSDSESESENYNFTSHRAAANRLKLLFADEVAERQMPPHLSPPPPPPPHHHHHHLVALSLWPGGDVNDNKAPTILRNLRGEKEEEKSKGLYSYGCLSNSHASDDVDTSLRL